MVISRKPISNKNLIEHIIEKGGSSPSENEKYNEETEQKKSIKITIRIPKRMLRLIDNYLKNSLEQATRTHWIKDAITDKVSRDIIKGKE